MDTAHETNVYSKTCPTRDLLDTIADKWTALVIGILSDAPAPVRFGELRRAIQGISQKMLTQTLRDLERNGLVHRAVYPVIPPRVDYSLTALGRTLDEPLRALGVWSQEHFAEVRAAQEAFDARGPVGSSNPAA
jgi:DNA-binding HxlR family transcriptional regulator